MMNTAYTHLTTNLPQYPTIKSFDINQSNQKSSHKLYLHYLSYVHKISIDMMFFFFWRSFPKSSKHPPTIRLPHDLHKVLIFTWCRRQCPQDTTHGRQGDTALQLTKQTAHHLGKRFTVRFGM